MTNIFSSGILPDLKVIEFFVEDDYIMFACFKVYSELGGAGKWGITIVCGGQL